MIKTSTASRKAAHEIFMQGQAYADQIPQCTQIMDEVDRSFSGANVSPRLPLLAQAVRSWLGDRTMSVLSKKQVAVRHGKTYAWEGLFEPGETDRSRHSSVSRWLNEGARWPFSKETARRVATCCIQQQFWLPSLGKRRPLMRHEYYHQLLEQLDSSATTRGNLASEAPGIYQCFRPSIIYPGRYVFGLFAVALMPDGPRYPTDATGQQEDGNNTTQVLRTIELHRISSDAQPCQGEASTTMQQIIATPRVEEIFRGYMVKKSRQVLVHAFDSITGSFQYTVISNFLLSETLTEGVTQAIHMPRREAARMQMLSGVALGLVGQVGFYSVPTVMLRVADVDSNACESDEMLIKQLRQVQGHDAIGILPAESIPEFVKRQFQVIERHVVLRGADAV